MSSQPGEALREAGPLTTEMLDDVERGWVALIRATATPGITHDEYLIEKLNEWYLRPLAAPVAEGLDVESGMTPEARAKYRAALAANQPVAEERTPPFHRDPEVPGLPTQFQALRDTAYNIRPDED